MAFCVHCGTQINDGAKFCTSCGVARVGVTPSALGPQPAAYQAPLRGPPAKRPGAPGGDLGQELLGRWNWKTLTVIAVSVVLAYLNSKFGFTRIRIMGPVTLYSLISVMLNTALPIVLCGLCGDLFAGDISRFYAARVLRQWFSSEIIFQGGYVTPYRVVVFLGIAAALSVLWRMAARYREQPIR